LPSLRFSRPSLRFEAKGLLCPVPEKFPFFAKKYRDKLCSLLSCQKKIAQSKSNILLFHAPFFTKSTKSAFAPNGVQQIFVALPN